MAHRAPNVVTRAVRGPESPVRRSSSATNEEIAPAPSKKPLANGAMLAAQRTNEDMTGASVEYSA
jgi:hypothetical protein